MDKAKLQNPLMPLISGEKIVAHSVSFAAGVTEKNLRSRHSAITSDLYSYLRYKAWTSKIRNAFDEPK
jgi:hypothetical protein